MNKPEDKTNDGEVLLGEIRIESGTILITDGVFNSAEIGDSVKQFVELPDDTSAYLPIYKATQQNKQFLIIPLDTLTPAPTLNKGTVVVEDIDKNDGE